MSTRPHPAPRTASRYHTLARRYSCYNRRTCTDVYTPYSPRVPGAHEGHSWCCTFYGF